MELDLCPSVTLKTGAFSALTAPAETIAAAINAKPDLQRFMFLFVSGNGSRIPGNILRTSANFEVCRAFTVFHLITILNESYHTIILVEHDPSLYEGVGKSVVPQVIHALKLAARKAMVILYAPSADFTFNTLAREADRMFIIAPAAPPVPDRGTRQADRGGFRPQKTLEAWYGTQHYEQQDGSKGPCPALVAGGTGAPDR